MTASLSTPAGSTDDLQTRLDAIFAGNQHLIATTSPDLEAQQKLFKQRLAERKALVKMITNLGETLDELDTKLVELGDELDIDVQKKYGIKLHRHNDKRTRKGSRKGGFNRRFHGNND